MKANGQTLSGQIHDSILEMVIESGSEGENLLLTEGELVERFHVSKAPVREALLKLCNEDVLKSIPRCGYVIVRLGEKSGRDISQVRGLLELGSMELCFDSITKDDVQTLRQHLDDELQNIDPKNLWDTWEYNVDFHSLLCSFGGNPYLQKKLLECMAVEKRFYAQNHWMDLQKYESLFNPAPHEGIYQAIRNGNKVETLRLLRLDIFGDREAAAFEWCLPNQQ